MNHSCNTGVPRARDVLRRRSTLRIVPLLFLILVGPSFIADELPVRLGHHVIPLFQAIDLELDPDQDRYRGTTRLALRVIEPVRTIRLHAEEMEIESARLAGTAGTMELEARTRERGELLLEASVPIVPDDYTLTIEFTNDFGRRAVGLYKVVVGDDSSLYTQFQANDAREAIPSWDEPAFKIPYEISLTVPSDLDAVSNTPVRKVVKLGAHKRVEFERTAPLPSYLLAIAVGEFDFVPIEGTSVPARVVVPRGKAHLASIAAEMTPPLLARMEQYFALRYPYDKLDLIAVPEFWAGAMENAGAITFRDTILLLDPERATMVERRWLAKVISHELAHMWFGDLVTMEWWDDLWLNESFADWFGDRVVEQVFPQFQLELSEMDAIQRTMELDARPSTGAVRQPIEDPDAVLGTVGLAYNKGKAILTMFERWIGEEAFRDGLRAHMREQAWGTASADEFFRTLSEAAGFDIEPAMRTFLDQSSHPLIRAELLEEGRVRLTQERYETEGTKVHPRAWIVPMVIGYEAVDGTKRTTRVVLEGKETIVPIDASAPSWIVPDDDATGYYRWTTGEESLLELAELGSQVMSPRQRFSFVGNASALLAAGEIDGPTFLRIAAAMTDDDEPVIVDYALSGVMDLLHRTGALESSDAASFVRSMIRPILDRYGWAPRAGESEAVRALRPRLLEWLGAAGHDRQVLDWGRAKTDEFLAGRALSPELRETALRLGALRGDTSLFDKYVRVLEETDDASLRAELLGALGGFPDPELRERTLRYALDGSVRSTEVLPLVFGTARDEAGREELWDWVRAHWDRIIIRITPQSYGWLPSAAGGCSAERLSEAEAFFSGPRLLPGVERRLARLRDETADCLAMRSRIGEGIARFVAAGPDREGAR